MWPRAMSMRRSGWTEEVSEGAIHGFMEREREMGSPLKGLWASSSVSERLDDPVGRAAPTSSAFQYKVSLTQSVYTGVEEAACCPSSWADGARRARDKGGRKKAGIGREG